MEMKKKYLLTYLHIDKRYTATYYITVCTPCAVSKCIDDKTIAYKI